MKRIGRERREGGEGGRESGREGPGQDAGAVISQRGCNEQWHILPAYITPLSSLR
jgi:hypothetical protein